MDEDRDLYKIANVVVNGVVVILGVGEGRDGIAERNTLVMLAWEKITSRNQISLSVFHNPFFFSFSTGGAPVGGAAGLAARPDSSDALARSASMRLA